MLLPTMYNTVQYQGTHTARRVRQVHQSVLWVAKLPGSLANQRGERSSTLVVPELVPLSLVEGLRNSRNER